MRTSSLQNRDSQTTQSKTQSEESCSQAVLYHKAEAQMSSAKKSKTTTKHAMLVSILLVYPMGLLLPGTLHLDLNYVVLTVWKE